MPVNMITKHLIWTIIGHVCVSCPETLMKHFIILSQSLMYTSKEVN